MHEMQKQPRLHIVTALFQPHKRSPFLRNLKAWFYPVGEGGGGGGGSTIDTMGEACRGLSS